MEGLVFAFSIPFLVFFLFSIISRIISGPPSCGNASQALQYGGREDEYWRSKQHKVEPQGVNTPNNVSSPYWDSHGYSSHGPGPTMGHGPGPHYDG